MKLILSALLVTCFTYYGTAQYQFSAQYIHYGAYQSKLHYNAGTDLFTMTTDGISVESCGDEMMVELTPTTPLNATYYSLYKCVDHNCTSKDFVKYLDANVFYLTPGEPGYHIKDGSTDVVWYDYQNPLDKAIQFDNIYFMNSTYQQIETILPDHFSSDTILSKDPDILNPSLSFPIKNWQVNRVNVTNINQYVFSEGDSIFIEYDFSNVTYPCTSSKIFFAATVSSTVTSSIELKNKNLGLFPNPATQVVNTSQICDKIYIRDFTGKIVVKVLNNTNKVDVSNLKPGIYIISLHQKGEINSQKLCIK